MSRRNYSATPATDKIRDDIDPANTWVVSDTHFGHDNIVGFCHRPEDHEQVMIAEWRAHVPEDATVLHLGDLCYKGNGRFKNIVAPELPPYTHADAPMPHKGRKLLIQGNHDGQRYNFYRSCGFRFVRPFSILWGKYAPCAACGERGKRGEDAEEVKCWPCAGRGHIPWTVSFSHYSWGEIDGPIRPWDLRVHGHIHNNGYTRDGFVPFLKQHINMSAEQTKFRPVNLELLLQGALNGVYPESTPEQMADARERAGIARNGGES